MRKRARIGFALLLVIVVGGIAWLVLGRSDQDPIYEGKSLSVWLDEGAGMKSTIQQEREVSEVVQQLGTNAIPTLLRLVATKDSPWTDRFFAILQKQPFIKVRHIPARIKRLEGEFGFVALGEDRRDAVPALIDLYEHGDAKSRPMIAGLVAMIGPEAKNAVPALVHGLGDTNWDAGWSAAYALGQIHSEPQLSVPVLANCLTNQDPKLRLHAVIALERFGADAKPAVPALLLMFRDGDESDRDLAGSALQQIDPEMAAKAGVKTTTVNGAGYK